MKTRVLILAAALFATSSIDGPAKMRDAESLVGVIREVKPMQSGVEFRFSGVWRHAPEGQVPELRKLTAAKVSLTYGEKMHSYKPFRQMNWIEPVKMQSLLVSFASNSVNSHFLVTVTESTRAENQETESITGILFEASEFKYVFEEPIETSLERDKRAEPGN